MAKGNLSKKRKKDTPWWKVTPGEMIFFIIVSPLILVGRVLLAPGYLISRKILRLPPGSKNEVKILIASVVVFISISIPVLFNIFE